MISSFDIHQVPVQGNDCKLQLMLMEEEGLLNSVLDLSNIFRSVTYFVN